MLYQRIKSRIISKHWQTRLVLWSAAVLAGLIVVGFAKLADLALSLFFWLNLQWTYLPFILCPLVGMSVVWLANRYFPGIQGSGIPQVIAARNITQKNADISKLVSLRIASGKILLGATTLVGGFSSGREGPSVQIAASILHHARHYLPNLRAIRPSDLILAGGAAGLSAAFNTPLAGIVFAVEELGKKLESRTSGVVLSTIIISGLTSISLLGNYQYFGHFKIERQGLDVVLPVLGFGVFCGLAGGTFSRILLWPQRKPNFALWRLRAKYPVYFAGGCGFLIAVIGMLSDGNSFGSGYLITTKAVAGEVHLMWYTPILRFLATIVTYFSGLPGGIFAPCLAVGAAIGSVSATLLHMPFHHAFFIALCMTAFLAAVTQSPITSTIIVMEMIDGHEMVLSLMAVALIAKTISARMGPELYQEMSKNFYRNTMLMIEGQTTKASKTER